ncbi:MAG: hypothetical protein H0X01_00085 [Nitrospira sp.]|nr:hypothetical protein [Nitrospira sp.]
MTDRLQAGQSRFSWYLNVLKEAGLIQGSTGQATDVQNNVEALHEPKQLSDSCRQGGTLRSQPSLIFRPNAQ